MTCRTRIDRFRCRPSTSTAEAAASRPPTSARTASARIPRGTGARALASAVRSPLSVSPTSPTSPTATSSRVEAVKIVQVGALCRLCESRKCDQSTSVDLVFSDVMQYVPTGFWPRLQSRLLNDEKLALTIAELFVVDSKRSDFATKRVFGVLNACFHM